MTIPDQPHRRRLVDLIRRIAVDGFGGDEVERAAYPGATFTVRALEDGLSGIRAAAIAQSVARAQLYEYAGSGPWSREYVAGHRGGARYRG